MGASLKLELQSGTKELGQIRNYNVFACMPRDKCSAYCKDLNAHEQYPGCLPHEPTSKGKRAWNKVCY